MTVGVLQARETSITANANTQSVTSPGAHIQTVTPRMLQARVTSITANAPLPAGVSGTRWVRLAPAVPACQLPACVHVCLHACGRASVRERDKERIAVAQLLKRGLHAVRHLPTAMTTAPTGC